MQNVQPLPAPPSVQFVTYAVISIPATLLSQGATDAEIASFVRGTYQASAASGRPQKVTTTESRVLRVVRESAVDGVCSMTGGELGRLAGTSEQVAHKSLVSLKRAGLIAYAPNSGSRGRRIEIIQQPVAN